MVTRGEPLRAPSTEASATVELSMGKSDAKNAGDFMRLAQQAPRILFSNFPSHGVILFLQIVIGQ